MGRLAVAIGCLVLVAAGCSTGGQQAHLADPTTPIPTQPPPTEPGRLLEKEPEHARERGSEGWRLSRFEPGRIEAYTTSSGGPPGSRVGVKASTSSDWFRVLAYRIGAYRGGTGHLVWRSEPVRGRVQADPEFAPYDTRTVVAPWARDLTMDTTGWQPGLYVLKVRTGSGWATQMPYVVSTPEARGTIAIVAPVTTWQAYNVWGGYSLYAGPENDRRSWAVSFDRPYSGVLGANDYRTNLVPVVVLAERSGARLSYFTNLDLHEAPERFAGARGYLSVGHDEYWTPAMREHLFQVRDSGTNLAFLGANTMYWRIRLERGNRLQTGYRHDAHLDPLRTTRPREATSLFRDGPSAHPENGLTGMLYECYPVDTDYRVVSPSWWGFRGTGVRDGTAVHGLVGPESDRVYPDRHMPRPLQILSHSTFSCRGDVTSTQSVYYTAKSGAGVFTAGTLRWGCALIDRCERPLGRRTQVFAQTVTQNLLRGFAQGPVGKRWPARHNVDRFDLALLNGVSAS